MNKKRPVFLNLFAIQFPITAIVSILHRASGVLLFLFIPCLLSVLASSLASEADFNALRDTFSQPLAKLLLWLFLAALSYHIIAGIRHLLMDMDIGDSLQAGRWGARIVLALSVIVILLIGVGLWR